MLSYFFASNHPFWRQVFLMKSLFLTWKTVTFMIVNKSTQLCNTTGLPPKSVVWADEWTIVQIEYWYQQAHLLQLVSRHIWKSYPNIWLNLSRSSVEIKFTSKLKFFFKCLFLLGRPTDITETLSDWVTRKVF